MNPALAPRSTTCLVCKEVADLADVALRLWFEDGEAIEGGAWRVAEYLMSIGIPGTKRALHARAVRHRAHAERYINGERTNVKIVDFPDAGPAVGDIVIAEPMGPARWLDVQQDAMDIGRDAIGKLDEYLRANLLQPKDLVAVAKMGTAAAGKRADLEAKGRKLNQMDELLQLAAGLSGQRQLASGES